MLLLNPGPVTLTDGSLFAVAATANKCLHGVPGAAFVIARRTALAQAVSRTYYLDPGRLARLQRLLQCFARLL